MGTPSFKVPCEKECWELANVVDTFLGITVSYAIIFFFENTSWSYFLLRGCAICHVQRHLLHYISENIQQGCKCQTKCTTQKLWKFPTRYKLFLSKWLCCWFVKYHIDPDSKVHGANMGPTWVLSAPDGPHVGPMNLAIREYIATKWAIAEATTLSCSEVSATHLYEIHGWWSSNELQWLNLKTRYGDSIHSNGPQRWYALFRGQKSNKAFLGLIGICRYKFGL